MNAPAQDLLPFLTDDAPAILAKPRRVPVRAHLRRVSSATPASGAQRKDAALLAHEAREAIHGALAYVREQLLALYESRVSTNPHAFVTADDVETILTSWPQCPDEAKRSFGPQHWRGTVFRKGWRQAGAPVPSLRPHMNATALPTWRPIPSSTGSTP